MATSVTDVDAGSGALLRLTVASAAGLFRAAACSVALLDPDGEGLRFVAAHGAGEAEVVGRVIGRGVGIAGWVVGSGDTLAVADVGRDPRWSADTAEATGYLPRVILAAPLLAPVGLPGAEEPLGVIEVLDPAARERDLELLAVLGSLLAGQVLGRRPVAGPLAEAVAAVAALGPASSGLAVDLLRAVAAYGAGLP